MKGKTINMMMLTLFVILLAGFVMAQPIGATSATPGDSSRYDDTTTPANVSAQAGNVTELSLHGISVTRFWQGFYGNITGEIVLANAEGQNFYDWNISSPTGQVYASRNQSVSWDTVGCPIGADITAEETAMGQNASDPDSISSTYTATDHPAFEVAGAEKTGCPTTQAYNSSGEQGGAFWQVLLKAGVDIVYTTVIEDATTEGFDGSPWHFQLLVAEDGTDDENPTTPYYFYLELQ